MESSRTTTNHHRQHPFNRHDFATKYALVLTVVTLMGLLAMSVAFYSSTSSSSTKNFFFDDSTIINHSRHLLQDDNNNNNDNNDADDYTKYSCNYIYEITPTSGSAAQCAFAKTCNRGAGIWAARWVFCSQRIASQTVLCFLIAPLATLWMVLLFRMLGSTAEDYFSPALEMFSVKLGLPPRFAGVSLLALGNGAADVSATVSAITSDPVAGYKLSLGALTGAAMVISGVISAVVILTADGVPCRGALVRDVAALLVTVMVVWQQLASGTIGADSVTLFLTLYGIFVLLVLTADVYHRAVVLPRLAEQAGLDELQRQQDIASQQDIILPNNTSSSSGTPTTATTSKLNQVITAISNYDNVVDQQQGQQQGIESEDLARDRPIQLHGQGGILDHRHHNPYNSPPRAAAAHNLNNTSTPSSVEQDPHNAYTILDDTTDAHACVQVGSRGIPADGWRDAVTAGADELVQHYIAVVWDDIVYDGDVHVISKFLLLCELPFTVLRKCTVPIPCEGYYCRALVALSLAVSPLWFVYYLWDGHNVNTFSNGGWLYFVIFEACMCIAALCLLRFAPGGGGELALIISTPIAFYGFVIAATWIDTIADALVSLLNFIGIVLRIPGPVIGLTILAWGNSMGDLSANVTMARKGLANMAMTACFAGPVFNILVGLGLGFSSLAAQTGNAENAVSLSPSVVTGFIFLAINAAAILCTGLVFGKGRIPRTFGYLALAVYSIYLVTSISLQYSKFGDN